MHTRVQPKLLVLASGPAKGHICTIWVYGRGHPSSTHYFKSTFSTFLTELIPPNFVPGANGNIFARRDVRAEPKSATTTGHGTVIGKKTQQSRTTAKGAQVYP
uniref:Uncharacterized protein n=1 Tax=Eutreptiella gymnastica TaxID=73025 RepID=A0A7S4D0I5_9EUGL